MLKVIQHEKNGYRPLSYIESTGVQGFNTGLTATTTDIIEIRGRFTQLTGDQWICGTHDGRTYRKVLCVMTRNDQTKFTASAGVPDEQNDDSGWRYCGKPVVDADTNTHTFVFNNADASLTVDGTRYQLGTGGGVPIVRHMPLFCNYHDTEVPGNCAYFQMEYAKFTQNNVLVRHYVPKTRVSDGVTGMYDKVNDVFYVSQTDTPFVASPYSLGNITALYIANADRTGYEPLSSLYMANTDKTGYECVWTIANT